MNKIIIALASLRQGVQIEVSLTSNSWSNVDGVPFLVDAANYPDLLEYTDNIRILENGAIISLIEVEIWLQLPDIYRKILLMTCYTNRRK